MRAASRRVANLEECLCQVSLKKMSQEFLLGKFDVFKCCGFGMLIRSRIRLFSIPDPTFSIPEPGSDFSTPDPGSDFFPSRIPKNGPML
jgi:hypothetical protein